MNYSILKDETNDSIQNLNYHTDRTYNNTRTETEKAADASTLSRHSDDSTPELLLKRGYSYIGLIGEGSNGKTYKGRNLKTGEIVAIKELKFTNNLKNYELFKREADVLKSISNPGVPRFYDYIAEEGQFTECWLVQEYVEGKSLLDMIQEKKRFSETEMLKYMRECAEIIHTLQTCYMPPIIHRDIKPSNILIRKVPKDGYRVCLIDFGAVANPQRRNVNSTVAGTVGYMPPEQLIGDCAIQSDYYALGATALHMLTGIAPSDFPSDGFKLLYEDKLKSIAPQTSTQTLALFKTLLAPTVAERPKDAEELENLFQSSIDGDALILKYRKKLKRLESLLSVRNFFLFIIIFSIIIFTFKLPLVGAISIPVFFVIIFFACEKVEDLKAQIKAFESKKKNEPEIRKKPAFQSAQPRQRHDNIATATVAAIFANSIEFYFDDHGKAVAFIMPSYDQRTKSLKLGDNIQIGYSYNKSTQKYLCYLND